MVVLAIVTVVTFATIPLVRRLAVRVGAVVKPDERRVHERPTPTLGGGAMLAGFLIGMLVAWRMHAFDSIFDSNTEPLGLVIAAVLMLAVGAIDDLREVSPPAKVAGIVVSASILVFSGISLLSLRIPFVGTFILDPNWSYLLSVIWVLGMANAINIIDGLDGLAGGIMAIAAGTFFLYAIQLQNEGVLPDGNIGPLIAILVLGMCLGFLPWNVHPAKIFMGDGGALLLGLLMAASTMVVGGRTDQPFSGQSYLRQVADAERDLQRLGDFRRDLVLNREDVLERAIVVSLHSCRSVRVSTSCDVTRIRSPDRCTLPSSTYSTPSVSPITRRPSVLPLNVNDDVRPVTARPRMRLNELMSSAESPSTKCSCSGSEELLTNGTTASELG